MQERCRVVSVLGQGGIGKSALATQALRDPSASLESRQNLLLDCLRSRRVLLVYDNLESFLEEGEESGLCASPGWIPRRASSC